MWPAFQEVPIGQPFLIYCYSKTSPKWIHNGNHIKTKLHYYYSMFSKAEQNYHNIGNHYYHSMFSKAAQTYHNGTYTCNGTDFNGKKFSANAELYVGM